jgi:hypothetical protein
MLGDRTAQDNAAGCLDNALLAGNSPGSAAPALTEAAKDRTQRVVPKSATQEYRSQRLWLVSRSGELMGFHLTCSLLAAVAIWLVASPAARAITIENKDSEGQYGVPKFDLEEQSKRFRSDGTGTVAGSGNTYQTPIGDGKLQFSISQGSGSSFASPFSRGLGPDNSAAQRQHFNRMLSAPSSLDYDSSR